MEKNQSNFTLKEVVEKLDSSIGTLNTTLTELRVTLSNDYRKKSECREHGKEINKKINTIYGWFFSFVAIFISALGIILSSK